MPVLHLAKRLLNHAFWRTEPVLPTLHGIGSNPLKAVARFVRLNWRSGFLLQESLGHRGCGRRDSE